ncbi:MAG: EpsG family protein [Bacilli bacterium]
MYVLAILIFLLALVVYNAIAKHAIDKKYQALIMIIIFLFFAFRFGLGSDTRTYVEMYENTTKNLLFEFSSTIRYPLYNLLQSIFVNFNISFPFFLLFLQSTSLLLIGYIVYKESDNILLSTLIVVGSGFIESYMTSMIRQMICMAIFFFAFYKYLKDEKYIKYYLIIFPTVLIHWVCIPLLLIPIVYYFKSKLMSKTSIIMMIVFTTFAFILLTTKIDYLLKYLPTYLSLIFSSTRQYFQISGLLLQVILFAVVIFLYIFANKKKIDDFDRFQVYLCFISFMIYLIFINYAIISRACDFLQVIQFVLIPKLINILKYKKIQILSIFIISFINFVLITSDIKFNMEYWFYQKSLASYPYISIFDSGKAIEYYKFKELPKFIK